MQIARTSHTHHVLYRIRRKKNMASVYYIGKGERPHTHHGSTMIPVSSVEGVSGEPADVSRRARRQLENHRCKVCVGPREGVERGERVATSSAGYGGGEGIRSTEPGSVVR